MQMTPIKLTLEGAFGIKAGLGRDSFTLDFSEIPDDSLTVSLKGVNGSGKSTLMNFMTPFLDPPWIVGGAYSQFGPVGLRELEWSHAGTTYRSRIEYRQNGKTKSTRAYLHQWDSENIAWVPVSLPDNTVSDGKSSTYSRCIQHILGPIEIYALSAFRAQGAPHLADYEDPKSLLRALLNLDEPAALTDQCKDVVRELRRALDAIRDQAKALEANPERIGVLEIGISALVAGEPDRAAAKLAALDSTARARAELDRAMSGDLDRQRLIEQRAAVQARLDGAKNTAAPAVRQAEQAHAAAVSRVTSAKQEGQRTITALERDLLDASLRVTRAQDTLAQRDAIRAAEAQVAQIAADIADQEQTVDALAQQVQGLRDLAAQIRTLEVQRDRASENGKDQATRLADLTARAGFVAVVPCHGAGIYADCPALKEAKAAEGQIPAARTAVEARRAEWKDIAGRIAALADQAKDLDRIADSHHGAQAIVTTLRTRLERERQVAAQASALDLAERNLAEAQAAVADLTARLAEAKTATAERLEALNDDVFEHANMIVYTREHAEHTVELIATELAAIPEPGTDQAVTFARQRLQEAEDAVQAAQAAIDQATAIKAQQEAEIAALRSAMEAGAAITAKARRLDAEIADWTLLAMGLRGVIDLSIEDAGPGIAAIANDLLNTAYGPRFSLRIVTQREQSNGKVVECFDISVLDSDSGMESSISQKSGGEAVILDRCLTDSCAIFQQDNIGLRYETAFADEADGALSSDNRGMFLNMERRAMTLGDYGRKYFVSHSPEAWEMADYVLDLADYRVTS